MSTTANTTRMQSSNGCAAHLRYTQRQIDEVLRVLVEVDYIDLDDEQKAIADYFDAGGRA